MLLGSILVTTIAPQLSVPMMILLYVYLIAVIIDVAVMWRKLKKKLIEKYGEASVAKGSRSAFVCLEPRDSGAPLASAQTAQPQARQLAEVTAALLLS